MTPSRYLIGLALLASLSFAQTYLLRASVLDEGGKRLSSSGYRCGMSIGQQVASGELTSSGYRAILGFWHGPYAPLGIEEGQFKGNSMLPLTFSLSRNFPNPFSRRTTIRYSLPQETDVNLSVLDVTGRVVRTLVQEKQKPGVYKATWDVGGVPQKRLPKGVYFCRLVAGDYTATRKMVKLE